MKKLLDVAAPAKLNLFLHVIGQRTDGLHELESVFALIDWCDRLDFEHRANGQLSREDSSRTLPAEDLVLRAARVLQQATGCTHGAHIRINKQIPIKAGLGGGSSDAATTLLALNRLWGLHLSQTQLAIIGMRLGADVPFFIGGQNAWVSGAGEKLHPIGLPQTRWLVVKPAAGLSTREIFSSPDLKRNSIPATISAFAANPFGFGRNDLQPVAKRLCPAVTQAISWLEQQGFNARMTGAGSAVFAPFPGAESANRIKQKLESDLPRGWQMRSCNGLPVHPLIGWAKNDQGDDRVVRSSPV